MRSALRIRGDVSTLAEHRDERAQSFREHNAMARQGRSDSAMAVRMPSGNARAALSNTVQDRTLGRRNGWRLDPTRDERARHGAVRTRNTVTLAGMERDK